MEAQTASESQERERTAAQLVTDLSEQTARLVRQEMELARVELSQKGKQAGLGAGMFGGAGIFVVYAMGALVAAAILGLSKAVTSWLAAVIVAGALGLLAGVSALIGKHELGHGVPLVPEQTIETLREDVEVARERAREGRA
jgi:Putative Actinobacterial Holin-X, holin superfamily III